MIKYSECKLDDKKLRELGMVLVRRKGDKGPEGT